MALQQFQVIDTSKEIPEVHSVFYQQDLAETALQYISEDTEVDQNLLTITPIQL